MAREYSKESVTLRVAQRRYNMVALTIALFFSGTFVLMLSVGSDLPAPCLFLIFGLVPAAAIFTSTASFSHHQWLESEREKESKRRNGKPVLGMPPQRNAFEVAMVDLRRRGKIMIDKYLVGFELDNGDPIWVTDDEICSHGCVFAKTGVGKTLWLEGLMFQQMARGRASGFTFIDAKRDPGTLADIIMMALITGRIEDLIVVDPFDPVCAYNFVFTTQRADVKARKVLRCGLPPAADSSPTKHYDRLAADAVYRIVRCMESLGLAWSVRDVAIALSAFNFAYPRLRELLHEQGAKQAMVELGHLAATYKTVKGQLDFARLNENLRGIAAELSSISNSEAGEMFCTPRAELSLTDAILRGKFVYYMLPRLEEAESAARMVKVFREDLEVSIGEVTSSRTARLEDPHLVIIDEGASTFGPTWANLFELARKGRFALLFGAQSIGGLMDEQMGLSEQFYERVIANVNLKVIMRIGDNRTAEDMCEWIGKISTTKKSLATGVSTSLNARQLTRHLELNKRLADGSRDAVTVAEDETDLVSAEELKHEMSAEKGLAWFDKGDGRLRKGRALWFESELPATWEGREFLTHYETVEADEIGLAEWVDEHILSIERTEAERGSDGSFGSVVGPTGGGPGGSGPSGPDGGGAAEDPAKDKAEDDGSPFRFNLLRGFRGRGRASTFVDKPTDKAPGDAPVTEQSATSDHNNQVLPDSKPEQRLPGEVVTPPGVSQPAGSAERAAVPAERAAETKPGEAPSKERATTERRRDPRPPLQFRNGPAADAVVPPAVQQQPRQTGSPRPKGNERPGNAPAPAPLPPRPNQKGGQGEAKLPSQAAAEGGATPPAAPGAKDGAPTKPRTGGLALRGKGKDTTVAIGGKSR